MKTVAIKCLMGRLCLAGLLVWPAYGMGNIRVVDGLLDQARSARLEGDYQLAEGVLSRAQRIAPRHGGVYLEYAKLRKDQGDYDAMREIVDVGAAIAEGPPEGVAQLRVLKNELAILLPLGPQEELTTPPVAKNAVEQTNSQPARDRRGQDSLAIVTNKVARDEYGAPRSMSDSDRDERLASVNDERPVGTDSNKSLDDAQLSSAERVADNERPGSDSVSKQSLAGEKGSGSSGTRTAQLISLAPQANSQAVATVDQIEEAGFRGGDTHDQQVAEVRSELRPKMNISGLGILNRVQSGTWVSRGPIEVDF